MLEAVDADLGDVINEHMFEIHAGAAYANFGLADGLEQEGAAVEQPLGAWPREATRLTTSRPGCL